MVASAHPLATAAGIEVLKGGGTAADAAVAVNAVLNVTQPSYCGIGGDFFCLYYDVRARKVSFLNGAGRSGSRASLEELQRRGLDRLPRMGPESVVVPGCVRAWSMLLERFGTRALGELLAPAIRHAGEGFPITPLISGAIAEKSGAIDDPEWRRIFLPRGVPPGPGDLFVQPDLARSLAALAADGADAFYKGSIARAIARLIGGPHYGIWHVTNSGSCSWYDFAAAILEIAGLTGTHLQPIGSKDLERPAPRPRNSVLRNYCWELEGWPPLRPWSDALRDYLAHPEVAT